ncbi:T9SS C-terminal target domain-containing protein [Chryseobacterium carnipullorum]|uniref:T9SS C-terminal target domain-containing protein n=1 Tax=Chryseobacterium carnipullorum TaxID=1124835 RepID=A0A3G6NJC6_CHRCU|nr:T9SS type A sorting domain-containing protein [Chryseobacterium carnipullorum]AZA50925.1 T9SS C-terminal target domain-containing protein [Chryseobacterium carnipullorum]AZA65786.1 T9SS C-terminal target domain-containing protein [Chryseobacterium carnipullorum]
MKKTFLFFVVAFIMSWNNFNAQQSSDYIIMLDNGGSTTNDSYAHMKRGAVKLIEQLLACNPRNRVAVVQYGAGIYGDPAGANKALIYIESDFTNDGFIAQNFKRRLDFGDYFNESLDLIGTAFNGAFTPDIVSSQNTLNLSQPLKIVIFTDAERNSGTPNDSYLVNYNNTGLNSPLAFEDVVKFKVDYQTQFTMIHANTDTQALQAAASISSAGGLYSGPLETNIADPDNGALSRLYYNRPNGFSVGHTEVDYWKELATNICDPGSLATVNFRYEPGECIESTSGIGGYYNLPAGATLVNFKLEIVSVEDGTVFPVTFNPSFGAGNFFNYYFQPSDFNYPVNNGATGEQKFRLSMVYLQNGSYKIAYSWNNYPYFDYDITMKCPPVPRAAKPLAGEKIFKLTPNPTTGLFKVILKNKLESARLEIRDLSGNAVYSKMLRNEKEIDIDISSRKEGVYIVNVINNKNEIYSEKIIKK